MKKRILFIIGLICCLGLLSTPAMADKTMDRIEKTGVLRVGLREGSIPFAYMDPKVGKQVGFSVDMAHELAKNLSKHFGKEIEIKTFTVTPKTRIPMVVSNTIDVETGSTTYTEKREKVADFSHIFFFSDTTFLVAKEAGVETLQDLNGMRVAAARGTTNLAAVRKKAAEGEFEPAKILTVETHPKGMLALRTGKIDAYSTDRSLLEGIRMKAPNAEEWETVPFAIAYEPYAYILQENNSDFRDFVNNTILWAIKTGKFFELYEKWMGPEGPIPMKMTPAYKQYLEMMVYPIEEGWWEKQ
ncbi:MAG: transporter substrate-binding domain-containing protein [Desulfohalobiaceae bacterium]|nr:transporter substrate-binding domain-containing protein [Desulfohalobiaceae bacterium]